MNRRTRRNPAQLVVFNPPDLLASDVQAILYRHSEDGELYCHTFGGGETELEQDGDSVILHNLPESTGVQAFVKDGGRTVVIRHRGRLPVAKEF